MGKETIHIQFSRNTLSYVFFKFSLFFSNFEK